MSAQRHLMVDLETMGEPPRGAILRVGIVPFSLEPGAERVSERDAWLDVGLSRDANIRSWRHTTQAREDWWAEQSPQALAALSAEPMARGVLDLRRIVLEYLHRQAAAGDLVLWSKPPQYDLAFLKDLTFTHWPIQHRNEMCLRTLLRSTEGLGLPGPPGRKDRIPHVAVQDAIWQATQAVWTIRELRRLGR